MTPTEAVKLCRIVKAYCPQQAIDEYTADAYGDLLGGLRWSDCEGAVRSLGQSQVFISPSEIVTEVRRVRDKRVADYGPIDPPPEMDPDDTGAYARWLTTTTTRIADGDMDPIALAAYPKRDVIAELGHIGHKVPKR